jgi:hypothetical protein
MSHHFGIYNLFVSCLYRFRILVVGKVRQSGTQPVSGQLIEVEITEGLGKILAHQHRLQNGHSSLYSALLRFCLLDVAAFEIRLHRKDQIYTARSREMIIVILSSTSTLVLNPAMARACRLSGSSFRIGLIRAVQLLRDYMLCGRGSMPHLSEFCLAHVLRFRICVPTLDAINGSIGEGIGEILGLDRGECIHMQSLRIQPTQEPVPVVVASTKFDQAVAIEGGSRTNARARYEQSCRSLFRREPRDVPAEIVSGICTLFCVLVPC